MYTIGFDFNDSLIQLGKLGFSIRLFTERNVYAPDPEKIHIEVDENRTSLLATGLSWAGNQQTAEGDLKLTVERKLDGRFL